MLKNMQRSLKVSELQQYRIVYCCTNCDKSTLFKKVLKVDNDEKCAAQPVDYSAALYNSITEKMFIHVDTSIHELRMMKELWKSASI